MTRNWHLTAGLILPLCIFANAAYSAAEPLPPTDPQPLVPVISGPGEIALGRRLVLDASASSGLGEKTRYEWYIGDGKQLISQAVDMIYTPTGKGTVKIKVVIHTTINGTERTAEVSRTIVAYDRKIVLIAGPEVDREKLERHRATASDNGVYLSLLQPAAGAIPLNAEEQLTNLIRDNAPAFADTEAIVIWSPQTSGLNALMLAVKGDRDRLAGIQQQSLVVITETGLSSVARTARGPFSVLHPRQIVITRKEAIGALLSGSTFDAFLQQIKQNDIGLKIVNKTTTALRPWNLLTGLVTFMITHGISSQIVILLLILPVIATILSFLKQVIGITTYGLYTPSVLALSFLALGWSVGLVFLLAILLTGSLTRSALQRWRLLYIPKVAILLTVVSFTLLLLLAVAAWQGITFGRDTIFILLIMSTLAESLLNVRAEEGWYNALLGMGETILAALLCVAIVQWPRLQSVILAYPETVLLTLIINVLIGRFTGLRLVEYFRFQEIFRQMAEEE